MAEEYEWREGRGKWGKGSRRDGLIKIPKL